MVGARRPEWWPLTTSTALHPVDLEPTAVGVRTYATRRRLTRIDAAALLSIMVCLLYCLPATLIVPAMTYAGRPALLIAFLLWCWWLLARLNKGLVMLGPQPIRWVVLFYLSATLLSYLAGTLRGLPQLEANGLDFNLILTLEFLGVVLMAADGIPNWERLTGVLRVFVWSGGFMAIVALLQVTTQVNITEYIRLPGLVFLGDVADFQPRGDGGLFRVAGTATHYIEFSVVMAMAVPFAIHFARFAPSQAGPGRGRDRGADDGGGDPDGHLPHRRAGAGDRGRRHVHRGVELAYPVQRAGDRRRGGRRADRHEAGPARHDRGDVLVDRRGSQHLRAHRRLRHRRALVRAAAVARARSRARSSRTCT